MPSIDLHTPDELTEPRTREKNIANAVLARRLKGKKGKEYWRSLEELADTKEFREIIRKNFPSRAAEFIDSMSRRRFLKLMGASLALAGVSGCASRQPDSIVPYVEKPEVLIPGRPLFYATAMTLGGATIGQLVEQHDGRPTKVEGNPNHPNSLGATDVFSQTTILDLYDPDRSEVVREQGRISTWDDFIVALRSQLDRLRGGRGVRVLTDTVVSPTMASQIQEMLRALPQARLHQYEPVSEDNTREGSRLAFGSYLNTLYRFDRADVILSLDADFLAGFPHNIRYIQDWWKRRRPEDGASMSRFYQAESTHTNTGAKADHRLPMTARQVEGFARQVASRIGVGGVEPAAGTVPQVNPAILDGLLGDLQGHRGRSIVIAGLHQPPAVHALAHAMNEALGNVGQTVFHTQPVEAFPTNQTGSLQELVRDMNQARVELLLILDGNPVFNSPADLDFGAALEKVPFSAHLSEYFNNETSQRTTWHLPKAHYLESWSDARTFDGTVSFVQPLIEPLYGGRTAHEILGLFTGETNSPGYEIVREFWQGRRRTNPDFDTWFRTALHQGVVEGTHYSPTNARVRPGLAQRLPQAPAPAAEGLEVVFRPDPSLYDGRFANNGWLQELPKPISKLTWDNAVLINKDTAHELGVKSEDLVRVEYNGRSVNAPVFELVGQPAGTVTIHLGYGRGAAGRVGDNIGFDAYALRTSDAPWIGTGLRLTPLNERYRLATTQIHNLIDAYEDRDIIRHATYQQLRQNPNVIHDQQHHGGTVSMFPEYDYDHPHVANKHAYKWGMAIDMSTCVGCNACVVACQAENNIPIVGKGEVLMQREMHWLRIDAYFSGDEANPETYFQPMLCQHCEKAPCEVVCPVEATVHSNEGLNDMVYNRCVGTKYCSNNCPYKVRRFNFLQYNDVSTPSLKLLRNPDVTVRERGVMEKCTYCVQRIARARINAEREDRAVGGDEIKTACQAACPAGAIIFGDLNQENSQVARLHRENRAYSVLGVLNTQPRTAYMAKLNNPIDALAPSEPTETEEEPHG
ncbi:MAG: TAT-variant-translocated molybdopterin oxidoreductase [Chloroflexota bacterium]|nr:TAT-variant-translocated molybdopterin oxidoreductase [Chloroflexota bacterium]